MSERCCRCHTILTSEDKELYGANCHACERYEWSRRYEWDYPFSQLEHQIRFYLRVLRHYPGRLTGLLLHRLRGKADA